MKIFLNSVVLTLTQVERIFYNACLIKGVNSVLIKKSSSFWLHYVRKLVRNYFSRLSSNKFFPVALTMLMSCSSCLQKNVSYYHPSIPSISFKFNANFHTLCTFSMDMNLFTLENIKQLPYCSNLMTCPRWYLLTLILWFTSIE